MTMSVRSGTVGNIWWNYTVALTPRRPLDRKIKIAREGPDIGDDACTKGRHAKSHDISSTSQWKQVSAHNARKDHEGKNSPRGNQAMKFESTRRFLPSEITAEKRNDRQTNFSRHREDGVQVEEGAESLEKTWLVPTMMHLMVDGGSLPTAEALVDKSTFRNFEEQ
ncbi:uncharacterized protein EV420DRAFT_1474180 [Desarmillaria tabescens]|uniref:Uncharacterized protein n=1 Tax=Armillaria tabescens TaxID=1929756 RepID=A0AA39TYG4_ARMTA|nr:uncharacterized protein EV420DRAFT_1474180 [Desarmillaria tabescens]KAK0466739.1 hypothetical protein EV420DRAFT_1474180 [Desarmillaria tabescens]